MTETHYIGGMHAVKALLKAQSSNTQLLVVQRGRRDSRIRSLVEMARRAQIDVQEMSKHDMDALAEGVEHQGVLAQHSGQAPGSEADLFALLHNQSGPLLLLILDGLQDPHNLGACLRSADAAGVDAVIVPVDNSVGVTPVVRKVASGAADTVPLFQVTNLTRTFEKLKQAGIWIYGSAADADKSLYQLDLLGSAAIVMGSEGSGLRRLTQKACDEVFAIPMHGTVGSLNVSVATGICLFEVQRQRI